MGVWSVEAVVHSELKMKVKRVRANGLSGISEAEGITVVGDI